MTATQIKIYLKEIYGECRHDVYAMAEAINDVAKEIDANEWDLFHLLVENKPINSLMTHSYGFNTARGREIINNIKDKYYEYEEH